MLLVLNTLSTNTLICLTIWPHTQQKQVIIIPVSNKYWHAYEIQNQWITIIIYIDLTFKIV